MNKPTPINDRIVLCAYCGHGMLASKAAAHACLAPAVQRLRAAARRALSAHLQDDDEPEVWKELADAIGGF